MDTATTEIYTYCHTLSLHAALPIWCGCWSAAAAGCCPPAKARCCTNWRGRWWRASTASARPSTSSCAGSTPASWTSPLAVRSEEHTSQLQSLMRLPYAVLCLEKTNNLYTYRRPLTADHQHVH